MEGIRDRLYGFVLYSPKHLEGDQKGQPKTDMALDISFGSSGYALVLARAFKKVNSCTLEECSRGADDSGTSDKGPSKIETASLQKTLVAARAFYLTPR